MISKKIVIILLAAFFYSVSTATCQDVNAVRNQMVKALNSSKVTDSLYDSLEAVKDKSALITGYLGCLNALKAKYTWNPYYKLKYLNNAETDFKDAVAASPQNLEIRFMRFTVECNVPSFLGYNKNIAEDSDIMVNQICRKQYEGADKNLVISAIRFLIDSKKCTLTQVKELDKQLATLI